MSSNSGRTASDHTCIHTGKHARTKTNAHTQGINSIQTIHPWSLPFWHPNALPPLLPHCYVLLLSSIMWCLRCCLNDSLIIPVSQVPPKVQPISSVQFVLCCIVYLVKLFFSIMSPIFINYFILMYSWHMIVGLLDNNCNFLSTWFLISSKLMLCSVFPFSVLCQTYKIFRRWPLTHYHVPNWKDW